jgi:5-methylcytosine-specific restriction endonuclease McrA
MLRAGYVWLAPRGRWGLSQDMLRSHEIDGEDMKLSKKKREAIKMKFGGRCAYCGHQLNERWQADHVEPVNRKFKWVKQPNGFSKAVATGEMWNPENDHEGNLMPACSACNNDKHSATLEQWRTRLEDLIGVCERNHSAYRHALRFGLVVPNPKKIVFYFELNQAYETKTPQMG